VAQIDSLLNKKSGLLGLSGLGTHAQLMKASRGAPAPPLAWDLLLPDQEVRRRYTAALGRFGVVFTADRENGGDPSSRHVGLEQLGYGSTQRRTGAWAGR